jgi:SNF2 family DNA or RNA helicase
MRTYGTIERDKDGRTWLVKCEPQVALRMKRLFRKVAKGAQGAIRLTDGLETSRDLSWLEQRYPMEMTESDRAHLLRAEQQHKDLVDEIGRIVGSGYFPHEIKLAIPARLYQCTAIHLAEKTGGTLIADDVGLGKTIIGIGLIANSAARPALVVAPTHLPKQWKAQIEKFLPGTRVHILKKGTPYKIDGDGLFDRGLPDVIVSNYHKLNGWAGELAGKMRAVIFDEVQELRHPGSLKYEGAKAVAELATFKLGLSATPIHNYGSEFFHVANVLRPGALGDYSEFINEWGGAAMDKNRVSIKDPKAFGAYAREIGLMLRRTRSEVGRELPPLTVVPHVVDSDSKALENIQGAAAELARVILTQGGAPVAKMQAAGEFDWRLRQATGIAKAPYVAEFIRMLVESGEKVLLGGWHHEVYKLWGERLADLKPVFFTGQETMPQKEAAKQAFISGGSQVLIMSLRSGSGIDGLQEVCRTVVHGELDWSPSVHEQFTGRVFRDGQKDPVVSYYLTSDEGSDPVVLDVLGIKRGQIDGIRDPNGSLVIPNQTDPDRVKKLAAEYLKRAGKSWMVKAENATEGAA